MGDKKFPGAPFGTQCARFDVSGVYPSRKKIGTFTEINHCKKLISDLERGRGPGKYEVDTGVFRPQAAEQRVRRREQETALQARIPHTLCRGFRRAKRLMENKVGPGSYDTPDFSELRQRKPSSVRGVCDSREERFKDYSQMFTPGPGTYGEGGIPSGLQDEKRRRSVGTCPTMDFSAVVDRFPQCLVDSGLCPGTYDYKTFVEIILDRHVSKRGPYDLFTGRRDRPIICGHQAAPKRANLNPGTFYKPAKVLSEDLRRPEKRHHGEFSALDQYPALPSQRLHLASLSQCPRPKNHPGPGFYDPVRLPKVENRNPPPFLSSSPRTTKKTERLMQGNYTTVGVGRYDLAKSRLPTGRGAANAGHRYVFQSRVPRYLQDLDQDNFNQEKLRPINLPPHCRPARLTEL